MSPLQNPLDTPEILNIQEILSHSLQLGGSWWNPIKLLYMPYDKQHYWIHRYRLGKISVNQNSEGKLRQQVGVERDACRVEKDKIVHKSLAYT